MNTLRHYWVQLNASLWFVPLLLSIASVALATTLRIMQPSLDMGWLDGVLYGGDVESARGLLGALLTGMIAMTSLVVSITIVVLTLAAAQLGPRLIRNFTEDRVTQWVLGLFVATILFLLVVLRSIEGTGGAPSLSVTLGTAMSGACLFVLLFYIDRLAYSIVSDTIAHRITSDLIADRRRADAGGRSQDLRQPTAVPPTPPGARTVVARKDGYIRSIDVDALVAAASDADTVIRLALRPGQWMVRGVTLATIDASAVDERLEGALHRAVLSGASRTPTQDVEFELQRLTEMAVRALSPGVNDPYTAIVSIDNLRSCLAYLFDRPLEADRLHDDSGRVRVVRPVVGWTMLVDAAFDQIRQAGAHLPAIAIRLIESCQLLAPFVRDDTQRSALVAQANATYEGACGGRMGEKDMAAVQARHRAAVAGLSSTTPR
jgi:uncharacterized membrane protein